MLAIPHPPVLPSAVLTASAFRVKFTFAAQWLACTLPGRRFADVLADACARLGADVDRYSFIVADFHRLLLAGLPAHKYLNCRDSTHRYSTGGNGVELQEISMAAASRSGGGRDTGDRPGDYKGRDLDSMDRTGGTPAPRDIDDVVG
jgi:hypothetical protein